MIRSEITTLIPAVKHLLHYILKESVIADSNQLILAFDLIESPQLAIHFESDSNSKRTSLLTRMLLEANAIRESAEYTQIKIGELTQLMPANSSEVAAHHSLTELDSEDEQLWQLMNLRRGQTLRLKFPDSDIIYLFPDLPVHIPETVTRTIRTRIMSISAEKAELASIQEVDCDEGFVNQKPLPKRLTLSFSPATNKANYRPLLHMATDLRIKVEIIIRVALRADNLKPSYAELVKLNCLDSLQSTFSSWASLTHPHK
ncbi:MAG: hypothetical protein WC742_04775 [Gallionellaceae bacterium]